MLLTLARCRAQQTPIAMNAAVGVALVLAALTQVHDLASLIRPRTVTLWIPLVLAYWMTIGVRAALFIPSELPSSWTLQRERAGAVRGIVLVSRARRDAGGGAPADAGGDGDARRADSSDGAWPSSHALVAACAVVTLLAESMALTLDFGAVHAPGPRRGHARLRTPMAAVASWACAVFARLAGQARAANPWRRVVHPVDGGLGRRRDCLPRMAGATTSVCVDGRAARRTT